MTRYLKQNAVFVINCSWDKSEIEKQLPAKMRKDLAEKKAHGGTAPREVAAHNGVKDLVPDFMLTICFIYSIRHSCTSIKTLVMFSWCQMQTVNKTHRYWHSEQNTTSKILIFLVFCQRCTHKTYCKNSWAFFHSNHFQFQNCEAKV